MKKIFIHSKKSGSSFQNFFFPKSENTFKGNKGGKFSTIQWGIPLRDKRSKIAREDGCMELARLK